MHALPPKHVFLVFFQDLTDVVHKSIGEKQCKKKQKGHCFLIARTLECVTSFKSSGHAD